MSNASDEPFFSRWSRRKAQVRQETAPPAPPAVELETLGPGVALAMPAGPLTEGAEVAVPADPAHPAGHAQTDRPPAAERVPRPTLEEANALTASSDFSRFVAPEVDAEVKNAAMKKLFADPHFNVMDGLDTYIDDYGRADPIPKAMLRQMVQARMLGLLDDEMEEQPVPAGAMAQSEPGPEPEPLDAVDQPDPAPEELQLAAPSDPEMQAMETLQPKEEAAAAPGPPQT